MSSLLTVLRGQYEIRTDISRKFVVFAILLLLWIERFWIYIVRSTTAVVGQLLITVDCFTACLIDMAWMSNQYSDEKSPYENMCVCVYLFFQIDENIHLDHYEMKTAAKSYALQPLINHILTGTKLFGV